MIDFKDLTIWDIKNRGYPFWLSFNNEKFYELEFNGVRICVKTFQFYTRQILDKQAKTQHSEKQINKYKSQYQYEKLLEAPDILHCYCFKYSDTCACLVYENFRCTLEDRLKKQPLSYSKKVQIVVAICRAIKHLHEEEICIRNICPQTIRICYEDKNTIIAKLTDLYDIAILSSESPVTTEKPISISNYSAPEIGHGKYHNTAVDVWSLGMVFYELLFGQIYGVKVNFQKKKAQIYYPHNIPDWLQDILTNLLEFDPKNRFRINDAHMALSSALNCAQTTQKFIK